MPVPNIVAFRIDERLIHGQGQLWIKALGVNTVIVANDSASEDAMQQTLMKAVVPKTVAMRFFSIQHTCDVIIKEDISKYIALGEEDKAALREMRDKYKITFNTKTTASGDDGTAKVDLNKYL